MQYPEQVQLDALEMGFKAANKKFLFDNMPRINEALAARGVKVKFAVPPQFTLNQSFIKAHLNQFAPEWLSAWQGFRSALMRQENKRFLGEPALAALQQCKKIIHDCLVKYPLKNEAMNEFLKNQSQYMVRSTGKEDAVDRANPGGNESVACVAPTSAAIFEAALVVYQSNFELKSIAQRLKSTKPGEELKEFDAEPFLPVLVDQMIGQNAGDAVYSGVIYSSSGCTRIQAAPGHGELIVNSLGNFDSFYLTQAGRTYAEIMRKDCRISPIYDEKFQKNVLTRVRNSATLRDKPSFNEEVVTALHEFSKEIEALYQMRLDIEFVYEAETNTIQVVQARAIPLGDRRNMTPSSFSPERINAVKANPSTRRGSIITPEVLRAAVVTSPIEIIITSTISEALDIYLDSEEKGLRIKAVIVQQSAPDTSHEAGEFSSKAIPVLQIDNIHDIEQQVEQLSPTNALVIAPQHKLCSIISLPENEHAEKTCYENGILKEGLFRSSMSPHVTPQFIAFSPGENRTEDLMSFLYHKLVKPGEVAAKKFTMIDLRDRLDRIPDMVFGEKNLVQREALSEVTAFVSLLQTGLVKKNNGIDYATFQHFLLTAGELMTLIQRAEQMSYNPQAQLEYLNLFEKFNGFLLALGKNEVLSNSMLLELQEKSAEKKALAQTPEAALLPKPAREYFVQMSKIGHRILREENRAVWLNFCRVLYGTHTLSGQVSKIREGIFGGGHFASLINHLVQKDILDIWLNTEFLDTAESCQGDVRKILSQCLENYDRAFKNDHGIDESTRMIEQFERQVTQWKDPKFFEKGFPEYRAGVEILQHQLRIQDHDPKIKQILISHLLSRLINLMDLSTKSLENSTAYSDIQEQSNRCRLMLSVFYGLMNGLIKQTGQNYAYDYSIRLILSSRILKEKSALLISLFDSVRAEIYPELIELLSSIILEGINNSVETELLMMLTIKPMVMLMKEIQLIPPTDEAQFRLNLNSLYKLSNLLFKLETEINARRLCSSDETEKFLREQPLQFMSILFPKRNAFHLYLMEITKEFPTSQSMTNVFDKINSLWESCLEEFKFVHFNYNREFESYYLGIEPTKKSDHWWFRSPKNDMSLSADFNADPYKFGSAGRGGSILNISQADLFTLLHQNSVIALSRLSQNCFIRDDRLPNDLVKKCELIGKIPLIKVIGFFPKLDKVSTRFSYPLLTLDYNFELRSHSVQVALQYNIVNKKMTAAVLAYGGGGNENCRWNNIEMRCNFFLRHFRFPILKSPFYNEKKNAVSFSVEVLTESSASHFATVLSDIALSSFATSKDKGLFFIESIAEHAGLETLLSVRNALTKILAQHTEYNYNYLNERIQWLNFQIAVQSKDTKTALDILQQLSENDHGLMYYKELFFSIVRKKNHTSEFNEFITIAQEAGMTWLAPPSETQSLSK